MHTKHQKKLPLYHQTELLACFSRTELYIYLNSDHCRHWIPTPNKQTCLWQISDMTESMDHISKPDFQENKTMMFKLQPLQSQVHTTLPSHMCYPLILSESNLKKTRKKSCFFFWLGGGGIKINPTHHYTRHKCKEPKRACQGVLSKTQPKPNKKQQQKFIQQ